VNGSVKDEVDQDQRRKAGRTRACPCMNRKNGISSASTEPSGPRQRGAGSWPCRGTLSGPRWPRPGADHDGETHGRKGHDDAVAQEVREVRLRDRLGEVVQRGRRDEDRHVGLDRVGVLERGNHHPVDGKANRSARSGRCRLTDRATCPAAHCSTWPLVMLRMYGMSTTIRSITITTETAAAMPYRLSLRPLM